MSGPSRRRRITPRRAHLVDAAFLTVLALTVLIGMRTTYSGNRYLAVGMLAVLLGIAVAHLAVVARLPLLGLAAATAAAYFLFGGLLVLRAQAVGGVLPGGAALDGLATGLVDTWKQLLTTLPPVAAGGPLLLPVYVIGLLLGAAGFTIAVRRRAAAGPLFAVAPALAAVLLLGTARPAAALWQGAVLGVVALSWVAVRARRRAAPTRAAAVAVSSWRTRAALAAGMIAVCGVGAWQLGPRLGGTGPRVVLRSYVHTPFDLGNYPSPLAGFRKYTKDADLLYDQTLFTVHGLPRGAQMQIATLDDYNGSVWTATNGTVPEAPGEPLDAFQRVGATIASGAAGRPVTLAVRIAPAYAAASDARPWLPTAGIATSIRFTGPDAAAYGAEFRYNLATGSGFVAGGLAAGAQYTVHTRLADPRLPADATAAGAPTVAPADDAFVGPRADQWSARISGVVRQVEAVADAMRHNGAYSDGGPGQSEYLPGHSIGRLTTFLNAPQLVGDDEQYAAAFALAANYLGLPARVVLAAVPEPDGVVQGKDVLADVQLHVGGGGSGPGGEWVTIPRSRFEPQQSKQPDKQPPQVIQKADAAVVPPPNPVRPPTTLDQTAQPEQNSRHLGAHRAGSAPFRLPGWIRALGEFVGIPVLVVLACCLAIVAAKWWRRSRRRSRGSPAQRMSTGWRDLVDHARDLGAVVPAGRTRREEMLLLARVGAVGTEPLRPLAAGADAGVFGASPPGDEQAVAFWREVDAARRLLSDATGRWGRLRGALSLRSLRPGPGPVGVR